MDSIIQLLPMIVLGLIWAVPIYLVAQKRGVNPWLWAIGAVIPIVNLFVMLVFWTTTIMSIFDRLNALERTKPFEG